MLGYLFFWLLGFGYGLALGHWVMQRIWSGAFRSYADDVQQIIKDHDCELAKRHGWSITDEIEALPKPSRLQ